MTCVCTHIKINNEENGNYRVLGEGKWDRWNFWGHTRSHVPPGGSGRVATKYDGDIASFKNIAQIVKGRRRVFGARTLLVKYATLSSVTCHIHCLRVTT